MLKGWKTLAFNAGLAVLGVLQTANWVDLLGSDARPGMDFKQEDARVTANDRRTGRKPEDAQPRRALRR